VTGKDDWKPIMYCQNKTPMAMGFFGQPLAGSGCGALPGSDPAAYRELRRPDRRIRHPGTDSSSTDPSSGTGSPLAARPSAERE